MKLKGDNNGFVLHKLTNKASKPWRLLDGYGSDGVREGGARQLRERGKTGKATHKQKLRHRRPATHAQVETKAVRQMQKLTCTS